MGGTLSDDGCGRNNSAILLCKRCTRFATLKPVLTCILLCAAGLATAASEDFRPDRRASIAPNAFFETLARNAPRGDYPRYFSGEQSYFTVVGNDPGDREGLLNEEGALEVDKEAFSIEPFLYAQGRLATWNDVAPVQALERGYLPIPSVTWRWDSIVLKTTAFAANKAGDTLYARYRVENAGPEPKRVTLFLAIRPFQVNPPWQSLNTTGGVSPIRDLRLDGHTIRVNRDKTVIPLTPPTRFGASAFDRGGIVDYLREGRLPGRTEAHDALGHASGALAYELDLPSGASREIFLAIPHEDPARVLDAAGIAEGGGSAFGRDRFGEAVDAWEAKLGKIVFIVPEKARKLVDTVRSSLAYILINRDGPALLPGSRTYARSWIRDAALMSAALMEMGHAGEVRDFIEWYSGFQFPNGKVPCCVDRRGPDGVPENDSHGEFIYTMAEYYRYTRDLGFVRAMWPAVAKAVEYLETLRSQRTGAEYQTGDKLAFFGLMPDSISHEGYSARPVHAFWDDFWTLRGLKDAADLAAALKDEPRAAHFAALRDAFRKDLYAALGRTMARHGIDFMPGSVELGDFDATATAMAVNVGGELGNLPDKALQKTFDDYYDYFLRRRAGGVDWEAYTPYEVRSAEALVRLGRREQGLALLNFLMGDRRPAAWNHWAEVVWRDPRTPKFVGDMPHTWIGAEFVRAVRTLFAYERESDQSLVLAAGIPEQWLENHAGVGVEHLPTWFGTLNYSLRWVNADTLRLTLSGDLAMPPGKIVVRAPSDKSWRALVINGKASENFTADEAVVDELPAEAVLSHEAAIPRKTGNAPKLTERDGASFAPSSDGMLRPGAR
jgi:hypothetical protein